MEFTPRDFGKALTFLRAARDLKRADMGSMATAQHLRMLERNANAPSLTMVDNLAAALQVHPLTLLALSYCLEEEDNSRFEEMMGQVFNEVDSLRTAAGLQPVARSNALVRIKKHLTSQSARRRIVLSQALVDEAFAEDDEAIAWFRTVGMKLVPGRLRGAPTVAQIFPDGLVQAMPPAD
jgi:transcriptional regulator with XRE-family HTH domain